MRLPLGRKVKVTDGVEGGEGSADFGEAEGGVVSGEGVVEWEDVVGLSRDGGCASGWHVIGVGKRECDCVL